MTTSFPGSLRFVTTQWHVVRNAGCSKPDRRHKALEQLVFQYRPALCDYLSRRYRMDISRSEDLVQGFLLDKVLRDNVLSLARRDRGKFRTFLLKVINSYVIDQIRRESAVMRSPRGGYVGDDCLEFIHAPGYGPMEAQDLFGESLVRQLIAESLQKLNRHCADRALNDVWGIFNARLLRPLFGQGEPESFASLKIRFDLKSEKDARNRLVTGKRIFRKYFRKRANELLEQDVSESEEIQMLMEILKVF
jgi:DNA-directed RNA polymerase specialized sigma24 family protein